VPAGRPRNPAGAGDHAPILRLRQTAEDEAALNIIRLDVAIAAKRGQRLTETEAVRHAIRTEAVRLAGPDRLEHATEVVTRRRTRRRAS
jgi:hypothetical protein